ncbi:MAG: putative outer membrane protein [Moraxellaceae bacterium]|jgi:putative membrane protein|nr:putative outer membrane protein [Moraxellaceae bacterium]
MKKLALVPASLLALCLAMPAGAEGTGSTPGSYGGMSNDSPSSGSMPPSGNTGPAATGDTSGQPAQSGQSGQKASRKDRNFIEDAITGNLAEIQLGQIAQQRAQNPMVRDYAGMMVNDHTPARQRLMTMASQYGVTPPTELDFMHRRMDKKLRKAEVNEFDEMYIKSQVKDHKKMVELMEEQIQDGENPELKRFASEMLPKIREHLVMAQRLEQQLEQQKEQREQQQDQQQGQQQ